MSPTNSSSNFFSPLSSSPTFPEGVTAHIRDLMHRELPPPFGSEPCAATATMRAVEDLEHFHALLADALRSQDFTLEQATILVDACRGWLVNGPSDAACLWQEVEYYLATLRAGTGEADSVPEWQRVFPIRLRQLSALESMAVARAAQRVRSLSPDMDIRAALAAVGLCKAAPQTAAA